MAAQPAATRRIEPGQLPDAAVQTSAPAQPCMMPRCALRTPGAPLDSRKPAGTVSLSCYRLIDTLLICTDDRISQQAPPLKKESNNRLCTSFLTSCRKTVRKLHLKNDFTDKYIFTPLFVQKCGMVLRHHEMLVQHIGPRAYSRQRQAPSLTHGQTSQLRPTSLPR